MTSAAMTRARQAGPERRWVAGQLQLAERFRLTKPILSLWIAGAATAAYLALLPELDLNAAGVFVGMLLLAGGGATLNNVQDREIDRRFQRTCRRPLARRVVNVSSASGQGVVLVAAASAMLTTIGEVGAMLLGLTGLLLYNGVYTPMKRFTALSILPGALAGAVPVAVGWTAAGGSFASPAVWVLMALLMVWQLPHVWLLQLSQSGSDRCQMLPSLLHRFAEEQVRRLILLCVAVFAGLTMLLPFCGLVTSSVAVGLLLLHSVCMLTAFFWAGLLQPSVTRYRSLFRYWNIVVVLIWLLVVLDL
jgi:protoheme IX farnesyltransferase